MKWGPMFPGFGPPIGVGFCGRIARHFIASALSEGGCVTTEVCWVPVFTGMGRLSGGMRRGVCSYEGAQGHGLGIWGGVGGRLLGR